MMLLGVVGDGGPHRLGEERQSCVDRDLASLALRRAPENKLDRLRT